MIEAPCRYGVRVFGRYPLPLWRKIVGLILVTVFVWNFTILANQFLNDTFGGPGATWCWYDGEL